MKRTPISNTQLIFESHFPDLDHDRNMELGNYTNKETQLIFTGFEKAWTTLENESMRNKIALNVKNNYVAKLESDVKFLKNKLAS